MRIPILILLVTTLLGGCKKNHYNGAITEFDIDSFAYPDTFVVVDSDNGPDSVLGSDHITGASDYSYGEVNYSNSVKGHKEELEITGNFTGLGIDTLYVVERIDNLYDMYDGYKFYVKSNNPDLPTIEIYGCGYEKPLLVYEGDVDGDGKDEWGYLPTWVNSQWRQYRIYNYDNARKEWRFLYYDTDSSGENLLSTPEYVRGSGVDLVEKGPKPGLIKINYGDNGPEFDIHDTIVKPTYTRISKDIW